MELDLSLPNRRRIAWFLADENERNRRAGRICGGFMGCAISTEAYPGRGPEVAHSADGLTHRNATCSPSALLYIGAVELQLLQLMVPGCFHISPLLDRDQEQQSRVEPDENAEDDCSDLQLSNPIHCWFTFACEHVQRVADDGAV